MEQFIEMSARNAGSALQRFGQGAPLLGDDSDDSSEDSWRGGGGAFGVGRHFSANSAGEHAAQEPGCLTFSNMFAIVPQDRFFAVEKFGKFSHMLPPGLAFAGLDCCGCCVSFRSISSRITQIVIEVNTKTKDHVFVTAKIAIQKSVLPEGVVDAMYKLTDIHMQVESYVSDVVRSTIPLMTLCELFEKKDEVSDAVLRHLTGEMRAYGFQIHRALVTDITPDSQVVHAMNQISVEKYHRDAMFMQAEGDQIRMRRAAEGAADAAQLYGEGVARQRSKIIEGIREAIRQGDMKRNLSGDELSNLLVLTQWFETLREVAERSEDQLVFLPHSPDVVAATMNEVIHGLGMESPKQDQMS